MTSGMSLGVLHRIDESDAEQQSADSGSRWNSQSSPQRQRGLRERTESGSTQATDYDNPDGGRARGLGLDRIPDDAALGGTRVVVTSSRGGSVASDADSRGSVGGGETRRLTLGERMAAGRSPGVSRR